MFDKDAWDKLGHMQKTMDDASSLMPVSLEALADKTWLKIKHGLYIKIIATLQNAAVTGQAWVMLGSERLAPRRQAGDIRESEEPQVAEMVYWAERLSPLLFSLWTLAWNMPTKHRS